LNFVAKELVGAKRYGDAKALYEVAAREASEMGDPVKAKRYREKSLVAEELEKPYRFGFTQRSNPEAWRIYEALRTEGIPTGLLEGGAGDHRIDAAELFTFVDGNLNDPRFQGALHQAG